MSLQQLLNLQYLEPQKQIGIIINKTQMNKSKSESQLPNKSQQKNKSDFIYSVEDDAFIFQTKDLFLQVQFKSPIKEICEYLQQYEKYCFLAKVSSVGIKAQQERELYDRISISVNNQYQKFLEKTMGYVEDMIMNIHFMKFQKWHYYSQIINGYKTNLLNKDDLDCYGYNPGQFDDYYKKVMGYLVNLEDKTDPILIKQIKMELKANQKQIIRKAKEINENMYVKNPFKTQNLKKKDIESSQIFENYFKKVVYDTIGLQEAFDVRFHNAYDGVHRFSQFIKQFSLAGQNVAANIIKDYNQNIFQSPAYQKKQFKGVKQDLDMSDFYVQWQKNNKNLPILRNKMERVNFSNRIVWREESTSENFSLTTGQGDELRRYRYEEDEEIFANRIPANNPYFDFWSHTYDRDRLRKLQLFYEQPKQNQTRLVPKDYLRKIKRKINKQRKFIEQNVYQTLISELKSEEEKLWSHYSKKDEDDRHSQEVLKKQTKNQPPTTRVIFSACVTEETSNKLVQQQRRIGASKEYHEKFGEDDFTSVSLRKTNNQKRIYEQFTSKFGIKDLKKQCTKTKVRRYGIWIEKYLFNNKDLVKLQQFLCNFLRQKLFREVEKYRDRESMPLIMNFKPASQFCNWRTIKKLGELTQTMKRYFIWASQIIKYEQIAAINKEVSAKFTIYSYTEPKHSQSIMFELNRRLNLKVSGEIAEKYSHFDDNSLECIISKLELMHRLLFNQHAETENVEMSFLRGEQLFNLIIKQVANDSIFLPEQ